MQDRRITGNHQSGCECLVLTAVALLTTGMAMGAEAQPAAKKYPAAAEVAELIQKEPFSIATWPQWRGRLLSWFGDRSRQSEAAFDGARNFILAQAKSDGTLPPALSGDYLAWYIYGHGLLYKARELPDATKQLETAEKALHKSIQLDAKFPRSHRSLAMIYMLQAKGRGEGDEKLREAEKELNKVKEIDPNFDFHGVDGQLAMHLNRPQIAYQIYKEQLEKSPDEVEFALAMSSAILMQENLKGGRADLLADLVKRFPKEGRLLCFLGLAQAMDNDAKASMVTFDKARAMGVEPKQVLGAELVGKIEEAAQPTWYDRCIQFLWIMGGIAAVYLVLMGLMALAGVILAAYTRGQNALVLLKSDSDDMLVKGSIARVGSETVLARMYGVVLFISLILFYLCIPYVAVGVLGLTGTILFLIILTGTIPIKLFALIAVLGAFMSWAVLASIFSKPPTGAFGILKTPEQLPQVHELIRDVAKRVDTEPADEVYIAPGTEFGVHQEGKGPFGIFGVNKRVLTLGLANMRFLTVTELRSVLAHEYGHFSHQDTFFNRFIYQVKLSITAALSSMGGAIGKLNYVNPFFWFLYLYFLCYNLLSAGYSRSREFLADRMAVHLYGSDIFASALCKTATEGTLFDSNFHHMIDRLFDAEAPIDNLYSAYLGFRDDKIPKTERDECYQKVLDEKPSLFASHPTLKERVEAVAGLPKAGASDDRLAIELFPNPDELEKELTEFMSAHIRMQIMQAHAEAQAAAG